MKSILWYQGEFGSQKGILVIDGKRCTSDDAVRYNEAFDILMQGRLWPGSKLERLIRYSKSDAGAQVAIRFNSATGGLFVQSHFVNQDEQGRSLAFMFYLKAFSSVDEVRHSLLEAANVAGKTVSDADMGKIVQLVAEYLKKNKNKYYLMAAAAMVILIVLIILCRN